MIILTIRSLFWPKYFYLVEKLLEPTHSILNSGKNSCRLFCQKSFVKSYVKKLRFSNTKFYEWSFFSKMFFVAKGRWIETQPDQLYLGTKKNSM